MTTSYIAQQFFWLCAIYITTLTSFYIDWFNYCGARPLLTLPILFWGQMTQKLSPILFALAGLMWDLHAGWPLGITSFTLLTLHFTNHLWQPAIFEHRMLWPAFAAWAALAHGLPYAFASWIIGFPFPWVIVWDVMLTICLFPLCVMLCRSSGRLI